MDTNIKQAWEKLSAEHQKVWVQHVIQFYPPDTVSPAEAVELAREEYDETESLLPQVEETCEAD